MKRPWFITLSWLLTGYLAVMSHGSSPATPTADDLARAVKDLGADKFADREKAMHLLWSAGADAIPLLEKTRDDSDPEVSMRARQLLQNIALGLRPDTPEPVRALVMNYNAADIDSRDELVRQLIDLGPPSHPPLIALARLQPDIDQRMYAFWPLLERTTEKIQAAMTLAEPPGQVLDDAVTLARLCMDVFPEDISPLVDLAVRLAERDDQKRIRTLFDPMLKHFDNHLAKQPDDTEALNNVAWLCAIVRQDLERATHRARQAVNLRPNTAAYMDTLAELEFVQGNHAAAVDWMKRCLKISPDLPYFQAQLKRFETKDTKSHPPFALARESERP
jgi:tetratricopeptide (TPR) repeat protein